MKKYLFYTIDGYTQDTEFKDTENCQMLGISMGENITNAYSNLINTNNYILEHNYNNIIGYEIIGEPVNL